MSWYKHMCMTIIPAWNDEGTHLNWIMVAKKYTQHAPAFFNCHSGLIYWSIFVKILLFIYINTGLQSRCATVFAQIANASCVSEDPFQQQYQQQAETSKNPLRGRSNKNPGLRLHAAHVLSMDSLLSMGLEMGSHSEECWKHVFR